MKVCYDYVLRTGVINRYMYQQVKTRMDTHVWDGIWVMTRDRLDEQINPIQNKITRQLREELSE